MAPSRPDAKANERSLVRQYYYYQAERRILFARSFLWLPLPSGIKGDYHPSLRYMAEYQTGYDHTAVLFDYKKAE
ncbi:hypothetical protein Dimus_028465, partial [Dionaea muscipula]